MFNGATCPAAELEIGFPNDATVDVKSDIYIIQVACL